MRATCFMVPLWPASSPIAISQWVRVDICAAAEITLSAGSFHHFGLMR